MGEGEENKKKFMNQFLNNLEQIFNKLYNKNPKYMMDAKKIIYNYELVKKLDFYGFHQKQENFVKIYVYDPKFIKPLGKILFSGAIMNIEF